VYELRSGLLLIIVSLLVIWDSFRVDLGTLEHPGPGFFPFCASAVLLGLSLALIGRGWRIRQASKPHSRLSIIALAALFLYALFLKTLGFLVATFLLITFLLRLGQPRPWWSILGMSVTITFLAFLLFGIFLKVPFPRGLIGI
jgi:putative tricarboxylic transport membrane protein